MATINSREIVDLIIAGNGVYLDDDMDEDERYIAEHGEPKVVKIVQYNNQFDGGIAYGLIHEGEDPNRYHNSGACHNPQTIWERTS